MAELRLLHAELLRWELYFQLARISEDASGLLHGTNPVPEISITTAAEGVAVALGLGAILAIVNALGMALDARKRELAIQRTVGFRRSGLAAALLGEVLVIGAICAAIAALIAWFAVNGHEVGSSTGGSAIQFRMHVSSGVVGWTLAYVLILGMLSALWPIFRAVRAPLTRTLQDE